MQYIEKKLAYHMQVYNLLKKEILGHRLSAGTKINESTLSQELQISRSPIREALRMLECDKLLISTPEGLIVNPLSAGDIQQLYECRMMLESFAAGLAAKSITEEQLNYLASCIQSASEASQSEDIPSIVANNTNFHEGIVSLCRNPYLIDLYNINRNLIILSRSNELRHRSDSGYIEDHQKILAALKSHDSARAEACIREHIRNDLDYYLNHLIGDSH